ncbi:MAG: hypothetical protein JXA90_07690 [Planctomycetes bacterium]|nr:hypothetical protein [Planctomycetota bacterium]
MAGDGDRWGESAPGSALRVAAVVAWLCALAGCATIADAVAGSSSRHSEVEIDSHPRGARVRLGAAGEFTTPRRWVLDSGREISYEVLDGRFRPASGTLRPRLNPWVWGNVLTAGLGCIVDFLSGSAWKLAPERVLLELDEEAFSAAGDIGGDDFGLGGVRSPQAPAEGVDPESQRPATGIDRPPLSGARGEVSEPPAGAGSVDLAWDPPVTKTDGSPLPDIGGYRLHVGRRSGEYDRVVDVGKTTRYTLSGLLAGRYYLAVSAYDPAGNESRPSEEIDVVIGDPAAEAESAGAQGEGQSAEAESAGAQGEGQSAEAESAGAQGEGGSVQETGAP